MLTLQSTKNINLTPMMLKSENNQVKFLSFYEGTNRTKSVVWDHKNMFLYKCLMNNIFFTLRTLKVVTHKDKYKLKM